jgi:hypothetical protein
MYIVAEVVAVLLSLLDTNGDIHLFVTQLANWLTTNYVHIFGTHTKAAPFILLCHVQ